MAIGDTVQAGLMRVDFSPFLEAGRANAAANASFGQALGQVAKGFIEGQQKKKRASEIAGFLMGQGVAEKDAMAIANNPFLQNEYQRKQEAEAKMKMERERLATQSNIAAQGRAASQAQIDQKNERADAETQRLINFSENLISETTDPAVQQNADMARPGLFALGGDPEMRNRFLDAEIERQPKTTVGNLGAEDFATVARETGMDPRLSANRFMGLQKAEAEASKGTGKTMTINDPKTGQNVIALQNSDGTPGEIVGIAPTQPPRIPDPRDVRRTNIDTKEDNQAMDTETAWRERAITGRNTTQTVKTMLSTLDKVDDTGGLSNFKNTLKKYAMSAGIDFTDAEKDQLANAEKFTQLSGEFVFKAISQTKGSISEKEMDLFQAMSPSMVNSKLGNRLMLEYAQKRANRDVELNKYIQGLKKQGMLPQERVEMAMAWLNDPANDITQDLYEHFGSSINSQNPSPQTQPNRLGVRGNNPQPSQDLQTSGGFKIKTR